MQTKKNIYFWASDISNNSGEGILSNSFIKHYLKKNKNFTFKNLNLGDKYQKKNNFINNKYRYEGFFHKYIHPLLGIYKLWKIFLSQKKPCYLNYLPLWNFIIFLLLPPGTIIGPITGNVFRKNFISKLLVLFELVSLLIIKIRFKEIHFSHNFYNIKYGLDKNRFKRNFILKDFVYKKKSKKKIFDLIIYFRNNSKLDKKYVLNLLINLGSSNYKYKFAIIGDKLKVNQAKNFGFLPRNRAIDVISKAKFAISNPENLYSYFVQDCLSNNVKVFYNKNLRKYEIFKKNSMVPIEFKSSVNDARTILKNLKKTNP